MRHLVWILVILSAIGFILAVAGALMGNWLLGVSPEGYSRACSNLALLAIVLLLADHSRRARE